MSDDLVEQITVYLSNGGLFNPEMMDHDKVRNLLMDCRDRIEKLEAALRDIMNERGVCSTCGKLAEGNGSGVVYCDPPVFGIDQGCRWSAQDPIKISRKALEGKDD